MKTRCIATFILPVVMTLAGSTQGEIINFVANIDGTCASSGSSATGSGTFTLNTDTGLFSWNIVHDELDSGETFAHIHGPIDPACGSFGGGQIVVTLNGGSPKVGSTTFNATRQQHVLDGLYYVNIHSADFGSGEIAGVIKRDPPIPAVSEWGVASLALLVLIGGTLMLRSARFAAV